MREVLLDRQGTYPPRNGYILVSSEVEFVKLAVGDIRLQVRGGVCDWAQTFFEARQIACQEILSPIVELGGLCAELDDLSSKRIVDVIGNQKFEAIERPLSVGKVLNAISKGSLWDKEPSIRHAAEWLLWLIEFRPEEYLRPLLKQMSKVWMDVYQEPERVAYSITDAESALSILNGWLGINYQSDFKKWGEFPLVVPGLVKYNAHEYWNKQIVETKGAWLDVNENWPAQHSLRDALAEDAYKYFKNNSDFVTQERFDHLATFLGWQDQKELQILLPPVPVSEMPEQPDAVLVWFLNEYLPYRRWQFGKNDDEAKKNIGEKARSFAFWYLKNYPKALSGSSMRRFISFDRAACVAKNSEKFVTLLIVLDGLHVGDAHSLHLKIQELAPRLSLVSDDLVFTALPTVTEFCKEALFKGVPPAQTEKVQPIGTIIPESEMPISKLSTANAGELLFWRIQEPDHTYHSRNKFDALIRKVEAELDSIAKVVQDIVDHVPSDVPLQIIITTDHGRLIAFSKRKLSIPEGMESHGRASWGRSNKEFGNDGYYVEGNMAYLRGERYGLLFDVAVPLTDETFITSDGKAGQEAFTHGGLYPEEVIIPWITFVRDFVKPKVEMKVTGRASAGKAGTLIFRGTNLGDVDIILSEIEINIGSIHERRENLEFRISKMSSEEFKLEIQKWPTNLDIKKSNCVCQVTQLNGLSFSIEPILEIQSDEMYQGENILEDLL